jgi:hypothetical protein
MDPNGSFDEDGERLTSTCLTQLRFEQSNYRLLASSVGTLTSWEFGLKFVSCFRVRTMRSEPAEDSAAAAAAAAMPTSSETTEPGGCWEQHDGSDESCSGGRKSRSARRCRPVSTVAPDLDLTDSSSVSSTALIVNQDILEVNCTVSLRALSLIRISVN